MRATPFLYFKGNCESALQFYQACGLGEIVELRRIEGTPLAERDGASWNQKVLFSRFEGPWLRLCASDGADSEPMKGCAIYIEADDAGAAEKLFDALSAGGRIA